MRFANPYTAVFVAPDLSSTPILFKDFLNEVGLDLFFSSDKSTKFNETQFVGAPFITNLELDFITDGLPTGKMTIEMPASSIEAVRNSLNVNGKYKYVFIQFGYWGQEVSPLYGFILGGPAKLSANMNPTLDYELICPFKKDYSEMIAALTKNTLAPFSKEMTAAEFVKQVLAVANYTEKSITARTLNDVKIQKKETHTTDKTVMGAFFTYMSKAGFGVSMMYLKKGLELIVCDKRTDKIASKQDGDRDVFFASKQYLPWQIGRYDNGKLSGDDKKQIILPLIDFNVGDTIDVTGTVPEIEVPVQDETGATNVQTPAGDGDSSGKSVVSGNSNYKDQTEPNKTDMMIFGTTATFTTIMYPLIMPYRTMISCKTPFEGLNKSKFLVSNVKHKLISDYSTEVTCLIVGNKLKKK